MPKFLSIIFIARGIADGVSNHPCSDFGKVNKIIIFRIKNKYFVFFITDELSHHDENVHKRLVKSL